MPAIFTKTYVLQCGHKVCSECVDGLAANGIDGQYALSTRRELGISCPLCRRSVRVRHATSIPENKDTSVGSRLSPKASRRG